MTNDFFKAVNPWLPMSYSVSGLRQTISMTGNVHYQVIFLLVTLILFIGLGMLAYQPKKTGRRLKKSTNLVDFLCAWILSRIYKSNNRMFHVNNEYVE